MFKGFILGVVIVILVGAASGYALIRTGTVPVAARNAQPVFLENWAADTSMTATLNRDAPKGPNPVQLSDANLIAGIGLFRDHCAICHGTAKGDKAPSPIAQGEYPAPPQMATEGVEDDPEGWTFWKIDNGIRWTGMPAWHGVLTTQQMWTLALFLKHMDKLPPAAEQAWKQVTN